MDTDTIIIVDDEGNEKEYTILFTFSSDEFGKDYVLYYDDELEEPVVDAKSYTEDGKLMEVDTLEEWDMIEEVYNTFMLEDEEEETEE